MTGHRDPPDRKAGCEWGLIFLAVFMPHVLLGALMVAAAVGTLLVSIVVIVSGSLLSSAADIAPSLDTVLAVIGLAALVGLMIEGRRRSGR